MSLCGKSTHFSLQSFCILHADTLDCQRIDRTDPTNTPFEKERWKNLSAFWAALTHFPPTNFFYYAHSSFRDAFGSSEVSEKTETSDFLLQTACIWFMIGADAIWSCIQEGTENFDHEKWEYWKNRLGKLRGIDGEAETRSLIDEALAAIEKAEHGGSRV